MSSSIFPWARSKAPADKPGPSRPAVVPPPLPTARAPASPSCPRCGRIRFSMEEMASKARAISEAARGEWVKFEKGETPCEIGLPLALARISDECDALAAAAACHGGSCPGEKS